MKILLTGGTGFIGRPQCAALVAASHHVTVLSRSPHLVPAKCGQRVRALASLTDWGADETFDAVINLCGEPIVDAPWTAARQQRLRDSRVRVTQQLVGAIARARQKPTVLLSGSAIGIYGDSGDTPMDETALPATDFAAQLCHDWEVAALGAESDGVRVCLLRTGLVLDPAGGFLSRMLLPFRLGLGARLGSGTQWMSWIALADYIAALLMLLEHPQASGPFNMTAPQAVTNRQFTGLLARNLNRPALFTAPSFLVKLFFGQRAAMVLGGQRALPTHLQALGYPFRHPELGEALLSMLGR
ncbi:MAG: TIGR01777 family oxidoreductase [Gammaproteobacteria bacterium]